MVQEKKFQDMKGKRPFLEGKALAGVSCHIPQTEGTPSWVQES